MYDLLKDQIKQNQDVVNHLGSCAFKNKKAGNLTKIDNAFFAALDRKAQLKREQEREQERQRDNRTCWSR